VTQVRYQSTVDLHGQPLLYGKPDVLNPFFIATRDTALIPA
jgi:3'(2'), 5'-bisphosphate nucleotidase